MTTTAVREEEKEEDDQTVVFERKLDQATAGLYAYIREHLLTKISHENATTIIDYILSLNSETHLSNSYRQTTIATLKNLVEPRKNNKNDKSFKELERHDIVAFLDKYRKPEDVDPLHKWIGTYNLTIVLLGRFFKWLYYPDIAPNRRPEPPVMQNIGRLKRREQTTYKPTDTWTLEDDLIFLKYCPSKRDRCFHMMSRDTGTRTHELLKLKIKDIVLTQNAESGQWYAEVMVNGKTGSRSLPMFYSIPFYKAWLEDHPVKNNPNAPLFCGSQNKKNFGRRLSQGAIYKIYSIYKEQYFAKLAASVEEGGDPTVSPEDKKKIKALLEKPWNPYLVHRHTTLTKLAREKGLSDSYLESIAGWKLGSNMKQKYVHLHANESAKALLKIWGVELDNESDIQRQQATHVKLLKPKTCLNCNEINESTAKFCSKCKFVMSFDAYKETLEEKEKTAREAEQAKRELAELKAKQEEASKIAEKRRYEIEDMQEKLKEVQKQIESLPGKLLSDMKRYEPEIVKEVKDKENKTTKQILLELPKTKTWHGEAVLFKYALEQDQLNHAKNMLKECPERVIEMLNRKKTESHQETAKKAGQA